MIKKRVKAEKIKFIFILIVLLVLIILFILANIEDSKIFGYFDYETFSINFVSPTPENNAIINNNQVSIKTETSPSSGLISSLLDWNNTLIGYWSFEYYNNEYVFDNSSYNRNMQFKNNSNIVSSGVFGKAAQFDGDGDYLIGNFNRPSNQVESSSVTAWIYPEGPNIYGEPSCVIAIMDFEKNHQQCLSLDSSGTMAGCSGFFYEGHLSTPNTNIPLNTWTHLACIFDYKNNVMNISLYKNGIYQGSSSLLVTAYSYDATRVHIGAQKPYLYRFFKGKVDEVSIHKRALSPQEIKSSYNSGLYPLENRFDNLQQGPYQYYAFAISSDGSLKRTETRTININLSYQNNQTNQSYIDQTNISRIIFSLNQINSTIAGQAVLHSLKVDSQINLSNYIFSFDNCLGYFINDSSINFVTTPQTINIVKEINNTLNCTIRWQIHARDNLGNWNSSPIYSYITTSSFTPKLLIILNYPINNSIIINNTLPTSQIFSWLITDLESNIVNCRFYLNNTYLGNKNCTNSTECLASISELTAGQYSWYLNCSDNYGNNAISDSFYFFVTNQSSSATNYTAYCGNFICDINETKENCCIDCGCSYGFNCINNLCQPYNNVLNSFCGNAFCESGETEQNCCLDCPCRIGYSCINNLCQQVSDTLSSSSCGNKVCEIGENSSTCCLDCGCSLFKSCKENKCAFFINTERLIIIGIFIILVLIIIIQASRKRDH